MTQAQQIRHHLEAGRSLTALEALELFGCLRLAARIADLREQGVAITAEMVRPRPKGPKVARYRLAPEQSQLELI